MKFPKMSGNNIETYIYKNKKLLGKMTENKIYILVEQNKYIKDDGTLTNAILDVLPEGIDLEIMMRNFNKTEPLEILPFLKNTIGDFYFSNSDKKTYFEKPIISNLALESKFSNILSCKLDENFIRSHLQPSVYAPNGIQNLSLSGYQHKLQVSITDNVVKEEYGDFILKPYHENYSQLPENEHFHMNFMREFGFEVPFNAVFFDEYQGVYHYLVKRFDIDEHGNKIPQISLNALMQDNDKYSGTIEEISLFLKDRLDDEQKMLFLRYVYANALLHNNDLHKKNISFVIKNDQLVLSPCYDVVNCYVYHNISNDQCSLSIKGHVEGIQVGYFKESAENIGLDFNKVKEDLKQVHSIFIKKYPQYVDEFIKKFNIKQDFQKRIHESYKKCFRVIKNEMIMEQKKLYQIKKVTEQSEQKSSQVRKIRR